MNIEESSGQIVLNAWYWAPIPQILFQIFPENSIADVHLEKYFTWWNIKQPLNYAYEVFVITRKG